MAAAILVCQFHKKVFQRAADWVYCNYFAAGQPDFLNRSALRQGGHRNLDKTVLPRAFKHECVNSLRGDHKSILGFQQLGQRPHAGHAAFDHNGQAVADLLHF